MLLTGMANRCLPCTKTTSSLLTKGSGLSCWFSGRLPPSYFIGVITPSSLVFAAYPGLADNRANVKQRNIEMYGVWDFMCDGRNSTHNSWSRCYRKVVPYSVIHED